MHIRLPVALLGAFVLATFGGAGCGDAGGSNPGPVPGTAVVFDVDADLSDPARFYDLPFPSDLRLDENGAPDLRGLPVAASSATVKPLFPAAGRRPGFPAIGAAYFRFDGPLAPRAADRVIPAAPDSPVLLVDVDPDSIDRGRLFPAIASTLREDAWIPENLLGVAAVPGIVLPAGRTYAFVVRRSLGDASGESLGVPAAMALLRAGSSPGGGRGAALRELYGPLWETLDRIGVARESVAAATVFSVGDVVAEFADLTTRLLARYPLAVLDLKLDEIHPRFCELRGRVRYPQFQRGIPPFDRGGEFEFDAEGWPILQREEDAPVVLALPRGPMPDGGYPLAIYFHGSGGLAAQVVDRGPVVEPGGEPRAGLGPAHVLAARGIASVSSASVLAPERLPGASSRAYLNLANLGAYPSTFRQGALEQRLLIDALSRLEIDPGVVAACDGLSLPPGAAAYRVRTDPMVALGQSLGGQYVNMVGAIEPRIGAIMPTGSGGLWSLTPLEARLVDGVDTRGLIPVLLGTSAPIDHLHPGLQLVQTALEPGDPLVYAARLSRRPLPGHPARSIYQPVGLDDPGFSNRIYAAMSLGHGVKQAGDVLWDGLQAALADDGLDGLVDYPVVDDVESADGRPYTGVVVQFPADGLRDAHHVFAQLDDVKYQYGCFFRGFLRTGTAAVPAPRAVDEPCPGE